MFRSHRKRTYAPSLATRSLSRSSSRNAFICQVPVLPSFPPAACIWDDPSMKKFVVKTLANAVALGVAVWLISGITLTGSDRAHQVLTLILVALVFGVVNFLVKPVVKLLSFPLFLVTLGLF